MWLTKAITEFKSLHQMEHLLQSGENQVQLQVIHSPSGIATDTSGNVYVTDTVNNRIQKFSSNGTFITKWGEKGKD